MSAIDDATQPLETRPPDARAFSKLQQGLLVLADISGYTAFVSQTEIDHSWEILHELLDSIVRSVAGRLDVSQVEGDAILFISGLTDEEVVAAVCDCFVGFHRRLRDMQSVTTCPCNACARIEILKLKFVMHHGNFSRQRLGTVEQLHGTDVIVAHRLLKNKVPSKEYLLVTQAVIDRLPIERQRRFIPYREEYDLGPVSGGYEEIGYLWDQARAAERIRVTRDEALLVSEVEVDVPIRVVAEGMLKPEIMKRYLLAEKVDAFAGARGEDLGSEFHCHHGDRVSYLRVVNVDPDREITLVSTSPVGDVYVTTQFDAAGPNRTRVRRFFWWELPPDRQVAEGAYKMLESVASGGGAELKAVFSEGKPSLD
jgi:hypothetical protein